MSPLKVPESGLHLQSGKDSALPPQAFSVNLNDNVIEGMIKCVRNGGDIRLDMGGNPTFRYGTKSHRLPAPRDDAPFDLYLTKPFESTRHAERLPHTSTLFKKLASPTKPRVKEAAAAGDTKRNAPASSKGSTSSGIDSDLEALKDGLAAHDAARERAHVVNKLPATKNAASKTKGKLLSSYGSAPRSMPTSPALNGATSPSTPALSSSQQLMERNREQRSPLVHELAVGDQSEEELRDKWPGSDDDFKHYLEKVAVYVPDSKKWALKTMYWKELNVWDHDYDTQGERQMAIDNAIRRYDKSQLGPSEPEWQKLLPKEERGKGKCLSKLQAKLSAKQEQEKVPPKIKVQKAEDSSSSKDDGDSLDRPKPKAGGEAMSRSTSNPLPSKAKKAAEPKKTMNPKARSAVQKPSPTKSKAAGKANGGRVLSQAIIENSDSSGDEAPVAKPSPTPKPAGKAKDTVVVKPKPSPREPVKQQPPKQQPPKRSREEDDDSSSSSGTPLAHRLPGKQVRPVKPMKQRPIDSSQSSRASAASSQPTKAKNTSPVKSSPLASSPPTNASELDDGPPVAKKRKAEADAKDAMAKRQMVKTVPNEVVSQAQRFKLFYRKYEALHYEISALDNPPNQKVEDLLDMRNRLQDMKREIYKRYASDRD